MIKLFLIILIVSLSSCGINIDDGNDQVSIWKNGINVSSGEDKVSIWKDWINIESEWDTVVIWKRKTKYIYIWKKYF